MKATCDNAVTLWTPCAPCGHQGSQQPCYFYSIPLLPRDTLLRKLLMLKRAYADTEHVLSEGIQDKLFSKGSNTIVFT